MEMNPTIYVHGLTVRFAMTLEEIAGRAPGQTRRKSGQVSVVVRRADPRTGRWLFDAVTVGPDRSGGPYRVRVRVARETRNPESERLLEKDIEVSCSCPAWRFWGSDYWASVHRYLWAPGSNVPNFFPDWPKPGRSFSDRSYPGLRDPGGQNGICKHVAAALGQMRDYAVPAPAVSPEDRPGQPRPGTASDNLWRKLGAADIKSYMQDKYGVAFAPPEVAEATADALNRWYDNPNMFESLPGQDAVRPMQDRVMFDDVLRDMGRADRKEEFLRVFEEAAMKRRGRVQQPAEQPEVGEPEEVGPETPGAGEPPPGGGPIPGAEGTPGGAGGSKAV